MSAALSLIAEVTHPAMEKHYSVAAVAALWDVSENTVRRIFEDMPGVLRISNPVLLTRKRQPRVRLSIPLSVMNRAHEEWSRVNRPKVKGRGR
jgi:hypothetical protein